MLRRFYDLRKEIMHFLKMKGQLVHEMENESWLFDLAFLFNITTHLNDFNTKLQQNGRYANDMYGHIKLFENKLRLWKAHIQKGNISHFQTLKETKLFPNKTEFSDQLQNLLNEFLNRFQDFESHEHLFDVFSSSFHKDVDKAPTEIQLELSELQARADLKDWRFLSEPIKAAAEKIFSFKDGIVWCNVACEQFFSKLGFMKSRNRSVLTNEHGEWTSGCQHVS